VGQQIGQQRPAHQQHRGEHDQRSCDADARLRRTSATAQPGQQDTHSLVTEQDQRQCVQRPRGEVSVVRYTRHHARKEVIGEGRTGLGAREKVEAGQRRGQQRNGFEAQPARKQEPEGARCQCGGKEGSTASKIPAGENERECQAEHGKDGRREADSPDVVPAEHAEDAGRGIHEQRIEAEVRGEVDGKMSPDDFEGIERIECLVVLEARWDAVQPD